MDDDDAVFRALADASRRRLLDRLHAENGQTLADLCTGLAMTRQAVTKHLAVLEAAHLVVARRAGREKHHYLNPVPIQAVADRWMRKFERGRLRALADLKRALEAPPLAPPPSDQRVPPPSPVVAPAPARPRTTHPT